MGISESILDEASLEKLEALNNEHVVSIVKKYIELCKPAKVTVLDGSDESLQYVRSLAKKNGEEKALKTNGHTIHFDGPQDQGRDLENTRILLSPGQKLAKSIVTQDREAGLKEIFGLMDGIMSGKEMLVKFYCLGPNNSRFSLLALQLTDSAYVVHSEDILYRQGYEDFKRLDGSSSFFHFVHSAGRLENNVAADVSKRRVFMDMKENRVFTINNQYAGNSVGLKKLALRLAIAKANHEDWLCEHMFLMGAHPPGKDRVTYFTGAFPSACGKTSTAMIPGQTIIGDDIAYLRPDKEGNAMAVNVEQGIFGIIEDVNPKDDALIYRALTTLRELIFSNILVKDSVPYWMGMGKELPKEGIGFMGSWKAGMKDKAGKDVLPAHKNARYTIRIGELENIDPKAEDPNGVPVRGFIYGGRDSDTSVPVLQSLAWAHGVFLGATIESETTAAALGQVGVRKHNPMSNIEFLTVPLGVYIKNHLAFGKKLKHAPRIFATNYFLKKDGRFLNEKVDKKVWLLWMEGRIHGEYDAIETPIGFIPKYDDLQGLFQKVFSRNYTQEEYEAEFSIRVVQLLEKMDRMEAVFRQEEGIPSQFFSELNSQRDRLKEALGKFQKDSITPSEFE
ncbi:phosphoenolpyruvate carboxykinase (GTP) [Candidatus Woesearchaeota archaeon]|nr:phosphoenolpyruvate carboxykinase (GTP) [Candidatus Woesearchaeota archaeon]